MPSAVRRACCRLASRRPSCRYGYPAQRIHWSEGGELDGKGSYARGTLVGTWVGFFDTGQKKYECQYSSGKRNGIYRQWHKNGQKCVDTTVVNGKLTGEVTFWTPDGTVDDKRSGTYVNGKKPGDDDKEAGPELLGGEKARPKPQIRIGDAPEKEEQQSNN